jgi:hypothetical protein
MHHLVLSSVECRRLSARRPQLRPLEKQNAGEPLGPPASHALLHGPYFGAGVWLKSDSSATQVKFAAMLVLPLPLYLATLG